MVVSAMVDETRSVVATEMVLAGAAGVNVVMILSDGSEGHARPSLTTTGIWPDGVPEPVSPEIVILPCLDEETFILRAILMEILFCAAPVDAFD